MNGLSQMMSPEQHQALSDRLAKQMAASSYKATRDHLAAGGSISGLDKGLDKGADTGTYEATGGGTEKGLRTHVSGKASSISPMTALIGYSGQTGTAYPTVLAANVFSWYDLFPPIGTTSNAAITFSGASNLTVATFLNTINLTPAQLAAAGLGQQPPNSVGSAAGTPSWLSNAGTNSQGLTPYQQYQLAVVYLAQNCAVFESLNINSSEPSPAPVVNSVNATEFYNSPYISSSNNTAVLSNATEPSDFKTNQIIILLEMTMSLLHFIQLTSTVQNLGALVISCTLQFNVRYAERRGAAFKDKVSNMANKIEPGSKQASVRPARRAA